MQELIDRLPQYLHAAALTLTQGASDSIASVSKFAHNLVALPNGNSLTSSCELLTGAQWSRHELLAAGFLTLSAAVAWSSAKRGWWRACFTTCGFAVLAAVCHQMPQHFPLGSADALMNALAFPLIGCATVLLVSTVVMTCSDALAAHVDTMLSLVNIPRVPAAIALAIVALLAEPFVPLPADLLSAVGIERSPVADDSLRPLGQRAAAAALWATVVGTSLLVTLTMLAALPSALRSAGRVISASIAIAWSAMLALAGLSVGVVRLHSLLDPQQPLEAQSLPFGLSVCFLPLVSVDILAPGALAAWFDSSGLQPIVESPMSWAWPLLVTAAVAGLRLSWRSPQVSVAAAAGLPSLHRSGSSGSRGAALPPTVASLSAQYGVSDAVPSPAPASLPTIAPSSSPLQPAGGRAGARPAASPYMQSAATYPVPPAAPAQSAAAAQAASLWSELPVVAQAAAAPGSRIQAEATRGPRKRRSSFSGAAIFN